ncbi:hypothetical protein CC85DRAFT_326283 [Cutaneotrichosporon oleaginosum]|uniref:Zn(2)-C6 fungal-type domain-containing protein n=1 Tax=Cutaneotrichosporon oleaginosum TaxID=879819 RepID=A0A0J0XUG5_9TREE|nr:uncharacterized protein CC85DRAFT_326283 [Cutaneotrichosporon oleaginosum]KLT44710.1 hypothetical protein CC85DRAFT_326283 [Cutaneotrichosporon oleaginosum]TXT07695.1 hypothetical protein COLE_04619 [Cutaneotrichosporon oleaginosum]
MASRAAPPHKIELAGGAVHVHLTCSSCAHTAWDHQQVAWLADLIAQQLQKMGHSSTPMHSRGGSTPAASTSPPLQSVPSAEAPGPVNLGKKGPRTRTGCFTCRMKRVKCDETKPVCNRCRRNPERNCVYPRTNADAQRERDLLARPKALVTGQSQPSAAHRAPPARAASRQNRNPGSSLLRAAWTGPVVQNAPPLDVAAPSPILPDQFGLFLDGISYVSSPGLLNAHPTKPGARARGDRVLAKLWEAQMFISAGGAAEVGTSAHATLAAALVSVTWSLGAVSRAFEGTRPAEGHDIMIARSRRFADDAAQVIHAVNCGEGFHDPETMLILLELLLLRDCGSGDPLWAKTHALLRTYAHRCGGPRKMIADNRAVMFGSSLYEQHLVYLGLYDTFASLSLGMAPYFLEPQRPDETQWIEEVASAQQVIQSDFGMSLHSLFAVAKLAHLLAQRPGHASHDPAHQLSCHAMYDELETTALATIYSSPAPIRVQFGDLLIRHSLICHLQRVAFGRRADDAIVQRSASAIMELLAEVAIHTGSMVNLNYPMLVVSGLVDGEDQERLQILMDFAKVSSGLVELDRLESIVYEVWRRKEAGEEELRMTDIWSQRAIMLIL